jgi:hypothetical protein
MNSLRRRMRTGASRRRAQIRIIIPGNRPDSTEQEGRKVREVQGERRVSNAYEEERGKERNRNGNGSGSHGCMKD